MLERSFVVAIMALLGTFPLACAHTAPEPPVAPEPPPAFSSSGAGDEDVPLIAPDEPRTGAPANSRLTASKTIGAGADGEAYDLERAKLAGQPAASSGAGRGTTSRGTTHGRGFTRGGARAGSGTPPVGGNFPAAKSFGPPAAR